MNLFLRYCWGIYSVLFATKFLFAGEILPFYEVGANLPGVGNFNTGWAGFANTFNSRQKIFAADAESARGAVVFIGDSITQSAPLAKLFPNLKTANRGIAGDTSRSMVYRFANNVLALEPRAVVILCGTNDMLQDGGKPEFTAANVKNMIAQAHKYRADLPIIVLTPMPNDRKVHETEYLAIAKAFAAAVSATVKDLPNVTLIDLHSALLKDGKLANEFFTDGVHLNDQGYEIYRQKLAPELDKIPH